MGQEYISINENQEIDIIALSKATFQTISEIVIEEEKNVKLASVATPFKTAINCKMSESDLMISVDVKVAFNSNVSDICCKVQKKIFENIKHMSGYTLNRIDVRVVGFIF